MPDTSTTSRPPRKPKFRVVVEHLCDRERELALWRYLLSLPLPTPTAPEKEQGR